ncbi:beta-lactamase family protein [Sinorhizobium numidicum]|uniref:Beta-lactamase family protein n=1 Tax=Sinorhizobium numidicum TaxID=680248 RepID=A0ABY8CS61_9HYPH|nr:serine hydrolase [Sinorhizobium numidicum]WEX75482.1 beta-lactamase family protein [Sinorhizobium numidicum]WEX81479.1 beta-lactamase family protein [Sinorhizobium numidicum]
MPNLIAALLSFIVFLSPAAAQETSSVSSLLKSVATRGDLRTLKTVIVARDGKIIAEQGYRGYSPSGSTNIKSASKSIVSALVGIAISKGLLEGPDQKIAPILKSDLPPSADARINEITIGNLLSMQAGLGRMSGPNYGRWVSSRNWVRFALAQPFDDEPGGRMLYSTASTHLLSAILTKVSGKSTLALARDWLDPVEGFRIGAWDRDPQGIYLGGNQMAMSARSLLAFGELYRNSGRTTAGQQIVPADWIERSWQAHTISRFSGDAYGYGWFNRRIAGEDVYFAWGYGGQMLYIVPSLKLTVVMTSEENEPSARNGYRDTLHGLLAEIIAVARTS